MTQPPLTLPGFADPDGPATDDLVRCVRCGLCLRSCPTYQVLGLETDSPRGRIHLMRGVGEGRLSWSDGVVKHLDQCLGCRACEPVCPSDVPYGRLLEAARGAIQRKRPTPGLTGLIQRFAFRRVLPSQPALRRLGALMRGYQHSPLRWLVRRAPLPARLHQMDALMPAVPATFYDRPASLVPAKGERRGTVALFLGCVMPVLFGPTQQDTEDVLTANGFDVVVPPWQTCCGALQAHGGQRDLARELARRNIDAFAATGADTIVINSAGCGALLKEYGELLANDRDYAEKAHAFAARVQDISEFLASVELRGPLGELPWTVTYQDACHLVHGQRIKNEPRRLLRSIPGLTLVELPASDRCCGSAGIYNLTQPTIASELLRRKIDDLSTIDAEIIIAGNPGCLIQIAAGIEQRGLAVRAMHTVSVLAESYRRGSAQRRS